ncbi:MAG: hypothetical protein M0Q88_02870 [Bacilli bacterium]|nr:hypothetical protein [Bacilli bacterium]
MLRRYVSKVTGNSLLVNEKHIKRTVRVIEMLKVPKNYKTVLDDRIEYIKDKIFEANEIENHIFIAKDDLSNDLKGLFEFYFGDLACFLYDEELGLFLDNYALFKEETIKILDESLGECLKKQIKPSQFLAKETYKGITLYDPETPEYMDNWKLEEKIKL